MNDHGNGVAGDDMLDRVDPFGLRLLHFFGFDLPRGIGDVHRPVEQRGDARPGPAACHRNTYLGMFLLVTFGPGQRQVDDGVRAFVFDVGSRAGRLGGLRTRRAAGCEEN